LEGSGHADKADEGEAAGDADKLEDSKGAGDADKADEAEQEDEASWAVQDFVNTRRPGQCFEVGSAYTYFADTL
jgi:hypothetical protein